MSTKNQIEVVVEEAIVKYALDTSEKRRPKKNPEGVIGRLAIISYIGRSKWSGYYICQCSCGKLAVVAGMNLLRETRRTESCGCIAIERAKPINQKRLTTHGMRFTKTYSCWANMKNRGTNPNGDSAEDYVLRGIDICPHLMVFENFLSDFGECPSEIHSIDRWPKNETGGYWCGHCEDCVSKGRPLNVRWGTQEQQARNQRSNVLMTYNGETLCIAEMSEKYKIAYGTLQMRVSVLGWSDKEAIETPIAPSRWSKPR